jgi:diguanylate cyclase (GGDEF)-like protein/PAS domain S-box-containing protein
MGLGVVIQFSQYISTNTFHQVSSLFLDALVMLGILVLALAIATHEKVLIRRHSQQQLNAINDLQRFYKLFTNAAEGLYTSTIDGKLISVNPAMCSLFGYRDEQHMLANIQNASQFYANPEDRDLFLGEIHEHGKVIGKEIKGIKNDKSEFWFSISGQIKIENNERYLFGSIFDITKRKQSDISLEFMATHDPLTGVYNRREFEKQLKETLEGVRQSQGDLALLYMDLDQFKIVNDTCGHKAGDILISELTKKLDNLINKQGMLARLGGDEFGVLLKNDNAQVAYLLANKILKLVSDYRFVWEKNIFTLGISIGHVSWQRDISSPEQLLSMADAACYIAKERGRNQIHTSSQQDEYVQKHQTELSWLSIINQAIQHNHFELYYQHSQALNKKTEGHHYEILLRMRGENDELIAPADFMLAAERYNLTSQIDRWVVGKYFSWLEAHPEHLAQIEQVNINISGHSLADNELKLFMLNAFEKHKIPYHKICFEMIESMAILKMEETQAFISTFQKLGCKFALDDFGCGFSSYNYLKSVPIQQLKIDGSFVRDILIDPVNLAMVNAINDVAKAMNIETVAEFVESPELMVELGKMGVDYAQGYGVSKPAALSEFNPLN